MRIRATAAAAALVMLAGTCPNARVAQDAAPDPDQPVFRVYELAGIPVRATSPDADLYRSVPSMPRLRPQATLAPWGAGYRGSDVWDIESGTAGLYQSLTAAGLAQAMESACQWESLQRITVLPQEPPRIEVHGGTADHDKLGFLLDSLRAYYAQRVNLRLYELPQPLGGCRAAAAAVGQAKARLLAAGDVAPTESLTAGTITTDTFLYRYYTLTASEAGPIADVRELSCGAEWVMGALPLEGGCIWVQARHAVVEKLDLANVRASHGTIELPKLRVRYVPLSVVLRPGEAAVLDGRYLIAAELKPGAQVALASRDDISVCAAGGFLQAGALLPTLRPGTVLECEPGAELIDDRESDYFRARQELPPAMVAARQAHEWVQRTDNVNYSGAIGPLVAMSLADVEPERRAAMIATICGHGIRQAAFQVQVYRLAAEPAVPQWAGGGLPTQAQVANFREAHAKVQAWQGVLSCVAGQVVACADGTATTYWGMTETDFTGADDRLTELPVTACDGWRSALNARDGCEGAWDLELTTDYAGPVALVAKSCKVGDVDCAMQGAVLRPVRIRFSGSLGVGEAGSVLVPAPEGKGERLLMLVQRLE
ncbi:MAG: hypothetical protein IT463_11790 [Planctomycetes bacterium]|nr:hypothetical protein [Planctomycetota bacterium]